jgi:SAM-dependent methyltransferase
MDAEKIHRWRTQGRGPSDSIHQLAVHRGLGPKADSTRQYEYIEEIVLSSGSGSSSSSSSSSSSRESLTVLDAGCGLGSGAVWMKRRHPSWKVFGVSMSPRQVDFCDREFSGIFQAELRSYDNLDPVAKYDVIYSVEALVHSPNLTKTLQHWALHLLPGGMIVLVDDYLIDGVNAENNEDAQIFADSWLLGSLLSLEQLEETAKLAGLVRGGKMVDITDDVIQWNYHGSVPQLPIQRSDYCHRGAYGGRFRQRLYTTGKLRYLALTVSLIKRL